MDWTPGLLLEPPAGWVTAGQGAREIRQMTGEIGQHARQLATWHGAVAPPARKQPPGPRSTYPNRSLLAVTGALHGPALSTAAATSLAAPATEAFPHFHLLKAADLGIAPPGWPVCQSASLQELRRNRGPVPRDPPFPQRCCCFVAHKPWRSLGKSPAVLPDRTSTSLRVLVSAAAWTTLWRSPLSRER